MQTGIREHWDTVRDAKQELIAKYGEFGHVYLMSLKRRKMGVVEGRICVASIHVAAMMLAQETHREATSDEVAAWKAAQEVEGRRLRSEKANMEGRLNVNIGDNVMDILARAALDRAQQSSVPTAPPPPQQESQESTPVSKSANRTATKTFE